MNDKIFHEIVAAQIEPDGGDVIGEAKVTVAYDCKEQTITLAFPAGREIVIDLGRVEAETVREYEDYAEDNYTFEEHFRKILPDDTSASELSGAIEELIQGFPTEPGIGCLIKAGLSTSVGQLIECHHETRDWPLVTPKVRAMLRCLQVNVMAMGVRAFGRTVRCFVSLGLQ
ncbi:MAG: hypothetical protein NXH88_05185 [Hyphomonas sp.]|nr:hypothetical protein [Hyphomonas sp.]